MSMYWTYGQLDIIDNGWWRWWFWFGACLGLDDNDDNDDDDDDDFDDDDDDFGLVQAWAKCLWAAELKAAP